MINKITTKNKDGIKEAGTIKRTKIEPKDTVEYELTEEDNIPVGKKVGDKIQGKILKKDNGNAEVKWNTGERDKDFPVKELSKKESITKSVNKSIDESVCSYLRNKYIKFNVGLYKENNIYIEVSYKNNKKIINCTKKDGSFKYNYSESINVDLFIETLKRMASVLEKEFNIKVTPTYNYKLKKKANSDLYFTRFDLIDEQNNKYALSMIFDSNINEEMNLKALELFKNNNVAKFHEDINYTVNIYNIDGVVIDYLTRNIYKKTMNKIDKIDKIFRFVSKLKGSLERKEFYKILSYYLPGIYSTIQNKKEKMKELSEDIIDEILNEIDERFDEEGNYILKYNRDSYKKEKYIHVISILYMNSNDSDMIDNIIGEYYTGESDDIYEKLETLSIDDLNDILLKIKNTISDYDEIYKKIFSESIKIKNFIISKIKYEMNIRNKINKKYIINNYSSKYNINKVILEKVFNKIILEKYVLEETILEDIKNYIKKYAVRREWILSDEDIEKYAEEETEIKYIETKEEFDKLFSKYGNSELFNEADVKNNKIKFALLTDDTNKQYIIYIIVDNYEDE